MVMLNDDEEILRKGAATQVVSYEGIGGKLLLTSKRLIFVSHSFNFQRREEAIAIKDIIAIVSRHSDYISRKISIHLDDKTVKEFIVYKRTVWVQHICDVAKAMNHEIKVHSTKEPLLQGAVGGKGYTFLAGMLARAVFLGLLVAGLMFLFLN
jgi:hypothetical protein